jgi:hypothetical protein
MPADERRRPVKASDPPLQKHDALTLCGADRFAMTEW